MRRNAAHTARDHARTRTVEAARHAAQEAARRAAEPVVPAEHTIRITQLTQCQTERDRLAREQQEHRRAANGARTELAGTSRLRPGRRRDLIEAITLHDQAVHATYPDALRLDREIDTVARQVTEDTRTREAEQRGRASLRSPSGEDLPEIQLSPAFPVELGPRRSRPHSTVARDAAEHSRTEQDLRRIIERHHQRRSDHSRGRDDSPGIGI